MPSLKGSILSVYESADLVEREHRQEDAGKDGMNLYQHIQDRRPELPVVSLNADGTIDSAVHTMSCGAYILRREAMGCRKFPARILI